MKRNEIHKRVKKLAEHANGPLGRIPLERVFEKHISFLEELRQFGATWGQIAQLLFTHGITQKSGKDLHANQVRVAFTRAQEKSVKNGRKLSTLPLPGFFRSAKNGRIEVADSTTYQPQADKNRPFAKKKASESNGVAEIGSSSVSTKKTVQNCEIRKRMSQAIKVRK